MITTVQQRLRHARRQLRKAGTAIERVGFVDEALHRELATLIEDCQINAGAILYKLNKIPRLPAAPPKASPSFVDGKAGA